LTEISSGIVFLNKESGITSFKAVDSLRRKLNIKKAGHTGTLDKFANGLLIVLLGKYTRLADLFSGLNKEYLATFKFGEETDTLDPEGKVIKRKPLPSHESLLKAVEKYTGVIDQVPPNYSAVHINGKRAYKIALKGEKPMLKPRRVTIYNIEPISFLNGELRVKVACSKGTYIRSLARDIGREVSSCAYVKELTRTKIGNFTIDESVKISSFNEKLHIIRPGKILHDIPGVQPFIIADKLKQSKILHGTTLDDNFFDNNIKKDNFTLLTDEAGILLAVVEKNKTGYRYISVFT